MARDLSGKYIGIQEFGNGVWKIFYPHVILDYINDNLLKYREKSIWLTNPIVSAM